MSGALPRPSRPPCSGRTSPASWRRPRRSVARAVRAPPPLGAAHRRAHRLIRTSWPSALLSAAGQSGLYLLEEPAVAVRVLEGRERAVVGMLRCGPVDAPF